MQYGHALVKKVYHACKLTLVASNSWVPLSVANATAVCQMVAGIAFSIDSTCLESACRLTATLVTDVWVTAIIMGQALRSHFNCNTGLFCRDSIRLHFVLATYPVRNSQVLSTQSHHQDRHMQLFVCHQRSPPLCISDCHGRDFECHRHFGISRQCTNAGLGSPDQLCIQVSRVLGLARGANTDTSKPLACRL